GGDLFSVRHHLHWRPVALESFEIRFRRFLPWRRLQTNLPELDRHRLALVKLQGEYALFGRLTASAFVDAIHGLDAVDEVLDVIPLGDHPVIIPVLIFDLRLNLLGFAERPDGFNLGLS